MRAAADAINAVFDDEPLLANSVDPWLADVLQLLAPLHVRHVWIVDGHGGLLSASREAPAIQRRDAEQLIAESAGTQTPLAARLADQFVVVWTIVQAGENSGGLIAACDPFSVGHMPDGWRGATLAAARLALQASCASRLREESDRRCKQLLAEQRTLMRDHQHILELHLNERERAIREKQVLIDDLERQVEDRTIALQAARIRAEQASREKSQFLANMSHEIRTPMTAILGYTDLLLHSDFDPLETRQSLETIRRNGDHLLTLINDILDLSKIESGKLHIERLPTQVATLFYDMVELMRVRATQKGIELRLQAKSPFPHTIQTDPTRLRQILTNIIGNAIKFTESGWVEVRVSLDRDGAGGPHLVVEIADTGIGIEPAQIDRVFRPFTQADSSTTRRFGGTGLGLTISRHLAESLGGSLTVRSTPGRGSIFEIRIATGSLRDVRMISTFSAEAAASDARAACAQTTRSLAIPILLAEDGPDNQRLITTLLQREGAEVTAVRNGRQAVDAAMAAAESGQPFAVVLMDMQMPELDGWGATRELRARGYQGKIIALTANAMVGDRERCLHAGCDDYATKPIERRALFETIRRNIPSQAAALQTSAS